MSSSCSSEYGSSVRYSGRRTASEEILLYKRMTEDLAAENERLKLEMSMMNKLQQLEVKGTKEKKEVSAASSPPAPVIGRGRGSVRQSAKNGQAPRPLRLPKNSGMIARPLLPRYDDKLCAGLDMGNGKLTLKSQSSTGLAKADDSFTSYLDQNDNTVSVQDKKKELLAALEDDVKPRPPPPSKKNWKTLETHGESFTMPTQEDDKSFKTDSQIGSIATSKIKEINDLEKWMPDDKNEEGKDDTGLFLDAGESSGWSAKDMFKTNEQNYGLQSTYKPNLEGYTVQLQTDKGSETYRKMEVKAASKAQEIERSKMTFKTIYQTNLEGENNNNLTTMDSTTDFGDQTSTFLDESYALKPPKLPQPLMSVKVDKPFEKSSRKSSGSSGDRKSDDFDLMKYAKQFPHGGPSKWFAVQKCLEIPNLKSPIGITVLPHNKNIVVGVTGDDQVHIYDPNGNLVKILEPGRAFRRPSDMCALSDGRFAVRDDFGIQLFDGNGNFLQSLCEQYLGRVYGLATDGEDNLITINTNVGNSKPDNPTRKGEQDVIIINIGKDNITRRIELEDVIPDKSKSRCRFLHCLNGKRVHIVDLGLDCVYVLSLKETVVRSFGSTGKKNGQFSDPAGLVSDQFGNTIIADSRNHRLQVFDRSRKFVGQVKFCEHLKRPSGIYLDQEEAALYILQLWGNSMVKYILEKN